MPVTTDCRGFEFLIRARRCQTTSLFHPQAYLSPEKSFFQQPAKSSPEGDYLVPYLGRTIEEVFIMEAEGEFRR
jgi:hypothetical protein